MLKSKFRILFVFITVFSVAFLAADVTNKKLIKPFNAIVSTTVFETENGEFRYRVSVFDGKLAVFDGNSKLPYKVYETYISSLPKEDVEILSKGIKVNSSKELMKIIEEYTS